MKKIPAPFLFFLLLLLPITLSAVEPKPIAKEEIKSKEELESEKVNKDEGQVYIANTLDTLDSILTTQDDIKKLIQVYKSQLKSAEFDGEKKQILSDIKKLEIELQSIEKNFEQVATNNSITLLEDKKKGKINFEEEILSLLKPAIDELTHVTEKVRTKTQVREKITNYKKKLSYINEAIEYIKVLLKNNISKEYKTNKKLTRPLKNILKYLKSRKSFISSQYTTATIQLEKIKSSERSFAEVSSEYLKEFFQKRGLYLSQALLAIIIIFFTFRFINCQIKKHIPAFQKHPRSFQVRLIDLWFHIVVLLLMLIAPMIVFYQAGDWVLFSLGILVIIMIAWGVRTAIPQYWKQIQLYLNIGSVREGERIYVDGLPWKVEEINVYTLLVNPIAGIRKRVVIQKLVNLESRAYHKSEPWFPCKLNEWVLLSDGTRGEVVGISQELVQLTQRGGALKTYLTTDFLRQSPVNLSVNFRIKERLGISYDLQKESTSDIPKTLTIYLKNRIEAEGYGDDLLQLNIEFEQSSDSTLDLVVIADFNGDMAPLYNRLRRSIQRWLVDACTENNWEIPFPQLNINKSGK